MTEGLGEMSKSFAFVFQEIYYTIFVIKGSMAVAQEEKTELPMCIKSGTDIQINSKINS